MEHVLLTGWDETGGTGKPWFSCTARPAETRVRGAAARAMLAAVSHPDAVRSLTLIEPGCYQVAADDPAVANRRTATIPPRPRSPA